MLVAAALLMTLPMQADWHRVLAPGSFSLLPVDKPALETHAAPTDYIETRMNTPFGAGLKVVVKSKGATAYQVQVETPHFTGPIAKGDTVFLTYHVRRLAGPGNWGMYVQRAGPPWTTLFGSQSDASAPWRTYYHAFKSDQDWAPGEVGLTFHIAGSAQTLEFAGMEVWNAKATPLESLPVTEITYEGRESNAPWRKEAERRIDRYRKADLTFKVVDAKGRPIRGAKIAVRMQRHAYEFGSFIEQPLVWQNADGDRYRGWFLKAYNKATTPMYWSDWGWESPEEHARYLQYPEWFKEHGIRIKAHVLIYPGFQYLPTRLKALKSDPKALWAEISRHIEEKLDATKKWGFVSWDIINETRDLHDLPQAFGSDKVYVDIFKLANRIDPKPTFYINENSILTNGGHTDSEQAEYERMIRYLIAHGAPVEGIGMQGHFGESLTPPEKVWQITDRFAKFGLPLQITEFDINTRDEKAQADYTRDLLTAWFAHPATTGFTMWGFWEASMWTKLGAMVRTDWRIKPNGQAWLDLVKHRWWTNAELVTDHNGVASVRAFKGDYFVTVNGKQIRTTLGANRTVQVKL